MSGPLGGACCSPLGGAPAPPSSGLAIIGIEGITWGESIAGNSYVVKNLGTVTPAATPNSPCIAAFSGQDINVGLVINAAEVNGSGEIVIQILNTIPASVSPPLDPEGDVTVVFTPA